MWCDRISEVKVVLHVCVCLCTFVYFIYAGDLLTVFPGRLLQISSFNGKMNALNEVNKVIASVTYYPHRHTGLEEEEWLTAERMAVSNTVCCTVTLAVMW